MQLDLHHREKSMILVRFRRIFLYVADHYKEVECYYNKSKLFVITVGIVNPSLLSITTSHTETMYHVLFWTVWTLQLLTSLVTAYVNFNKWDKRYCTEIRPWRETIYKRSHNNNFYWRLPRDKSRYR